MEFLKKSITTIDNAIEINKLKSERDDINDKLSKITDKLKQYDCQLELKNVIEANVLSNTNTMISIKKQFFLDNIEITENCSIEEFTSKHNNPYFINLFKLYSNLLASQKVLQTSIDEISSHINIDKQTYQVKKDELDKDLEKVNTKLKKVRTKQFKS
jgi:hypothetical protein